MEYALFQDASAAPGRKVMRQIYTMENMVATAYNTVFDFPKIFAGMLFPAYLARSILTNNIAYSLHILIMKAQRGMIP